MAPCGRCGRSEPEVAFYASTQGRRRGTCTECLAEQGRQRDARIAAAESEATKRRFEVAIAAEMPLADAWFAGFFDADGCVHIGQKADGTFAFACQIAQVDVNVLMRFRERFGGSVRGDGRTGPRTRTGNPIYVWSVVARDADEFLLTVLPWLQLKRERAVLALEFRLLFVGENRLPRRYLERPHVAAKRDRVMAARQGCYERMRVLNARGRNGSRSV